MAKKRSEEQCSPEELERILVNLEAEDDETRARATRAVCPCRMGWEGYQRAMGMIDRLKKDPCKAVRAAALHVIEDSFQMVNEGPPTHRSMVKNEMLTHRKRFR